jgi:putative hydrolase of the HAD superfamily
MRLNKRIKAVIFDLDDTLISWENMVHTSWRLFNRPKYDRIHDHITQLGHSLPSKEHFANALNELNQQSWEHALETGRADGLAAVLLRGIAFCGVDTADLDPQPILEAYNWEAVPGVVPFPDTHHVLEAIQAEGYKIGLITNAYQPMWMRDGELVHYDLLRFFSARITSGDTGFIKPHPAVYWRMLGLLGLMPHEAIFVGDRPAQDIAGAHGVGMLGVLMAPPHLSFELEGVVPDYTIASLSELLPILAQLY